MDGSYELYSSSNVIRPVHTLHVLEAPYGPPSVSQSSRCICSSCSTRSTPSKIAVDARPLPLTVGPHLVVDEALVFVVGAFAEMSEDVSRICDIIAHHLARTHVPCYNGDAKRTKGMYRQRI